jgi:RNA polymerase sigma-70 factor, ECF subfamily
LIDKAIIDQCREGNYSNFRRLIEESTPLAYSVAFRMLGNDAQANDVVQDTMVTVWQKLNKIRSVEIYTTWLYRIVVNKCYDELRKRKRNPEFNADERTWALISDSLEQSPGFTLENEEMAKIITILTDQLSSKQKAVFVLIELEGLSNDEVSEITGMSKSNVKANMYHARKYISEKLDKYLES